MMKKIYLEKSKQNIVESFKNGHYIVTFSKQKTLYNTGTEE
ncbi:hypothetical protein [Chryseobacterium sp. AG844]|nr:hypothetical protein [Chryseobacterium sp. AG844]